MTSQRLLDNDKPQSPAGFGDPPSPSNKSPSVISPPASTPGGTITLANITSLEVAKSSPIVERMSQQPERCDHYYNIHIVIYMYVCRKVSPPAPVLNDSKLTNGHEVYTILVHVFITVL